MILWERLFEGWWRCLFEGGGAYSRIYGIGTADKQFEWNWSSKFRTNIAVVEKMQRNPMILENTTLGGRNIPKKHSEKCFIKLFIFSYQLILKHYFHATYMYMYIKSPPGYTVCKCPTQTEGLKPEFYSKLK